MRHEINIHFEMFERYNLALCIIKKQRELIEGFSTGKDVEQLEKGIQIMIDKLLTDCDITEEMILKDS